MDPAAKLESTARPRILIVGFGDVAERLAPMLTAQYQVSALVRRNERVPTVHALGCRAVVGDLADATSLSGVIGIADRVVHLAPPPGSGGVDPHTGNLLAALDMGAPPSALVYVSTTGVYGDCHGELIDESRPTNPQSSRAKRRVDAEQQLAAWAAKAKANLTILRAPGIYAADRLPLERLRTGTPVITAAEDSYTNHIHADDLARCIFTALQREGGTRVYNCVDDSELKMGDYFDLMADFANLPRPPRLRRADIEAQVSPAMWSFMRESRRLSNARIKRELAFALQYPTVSDFLRALGAALNS